MCVYEILLQATAVGQRTVDASVSADEEACPALSSPVQLVNPMVQVGLNNNMKNIILFLLKMSTKVLL